MSVTTSSDVAAGPVEPADALPEPIVPAEPVAALDATDHGAPEPDAPEVDASERARPPFPDHPLFYATVALLVTLSFGLFGFEPKGLIAAFAVSALTVLAAIDVEHRLLPNRIVFPALVVVLLAQLATEPDRALEWLLAGPAAALFLAAPLIVRRDAMGLGDVKLALLLGAIVGWHVFLAIVIGCFAMLPFAAVMLVRDRTIKGATLPFGPFLAFGTVLVLFAS